MDRTMPMTMFHDIFSPKIRVPIRMAVRGSKTPITEALVAPMILVEAARVAVEMTVGMTASRMRLSHNELWAQMVLKSLRSEILPLWLPTNAIRPKTMQPVMSA